MSNSPIIITGIHRSGTSLLSEIFENEDIFFGKNKDVNNESIFFQNINKWIMSSYGFSWDNPELISCNLDDERCKMLLYKINLTINSRLNYKYFGYKSLLLKKNFLKLNFNWGWKDPRNIFTIPFWMDIFPDSKIVIVLRHPFDVVNSLIKRNRLLLKKDIERKNSLFSFVLLSSLNINNYSNLSSSLNTFEDGMKIYNSYFKQIEYIKLKFPNNIFIVKYEDIILKKNDSIKEILKFCNISLSDKNKLFMETIYEHRVYNFKSHYIDEYKKFDTDLMKYGYLDAD